MQVLIDETKDTVNDWLISKQLRHCWCYGTEEMSVTIRVGEHDLPGIRMQFHGEWGVHFHRNGKKSPGDSNGNQSDKAGRLHALKR